MTQKEFNWTRYWYPRDEQPPPTSRGLLHRPLSRFQYSLADTDQAIEINELLDIPVLILLGEPGMGKSYALKKAHEKVANSGTVFCSFHDLAMDFETADELANEIFRSREFLEWQQADLPYHLFLDSLDEAGLHIRTITKKLIRAFEHNSENLQRLYVRIACRTANWPEDLEQAMQKMWGKENVKAYVLAPLQQSDVIAAAQQLETLEDTNAFWQEVVEKEAEPFAARPVTLKFLLGEYLTSGQLPNTRKELYRRGCLKLCAEPNPTHEERNKLEPEQRFIVAARIAAIMIFTGYSSIRVDDLRDGQTRSLTPEECTGEQEELYDPSLRVRESHVCETLNTALFNGNELREWAHQTYAEFLSAWYVSQVLSTAQIKSLIFHPEGKLVPQLHETSAWIATFIPEVFDLILSSDPVVLLQSDVATADEVSRERLTEALLKWQSQNPHEHLYLKQLSVLQCEALVTLLPEFIRNSANTPEARELALDIGIACQVSNLLNVMVEIALNPEEPLQLRTTAAQGVVELGDEDAKRRLKPLAMLSLDNRNFRELKHYGILAVWPTYLSAIELFDTLNVPVDDNLIDLYSSQDWADLILPELTPLDLPCALKWVEQQGSTDSLSASFSGLLNSILHMAWQNIETPDVAVAFCNAVLALWQRHDHVLVRENEWRNWRSNPTVTADIILEDDSRRYAFLQSFIPVAANLEIATYHLMTDVPLLHFGDASWLINYFKQSTSDAEKTLVAELLRTIINLYKPEQFQFIYGVGEQYPELWQALQFKLFVELDSDDATKARESYLRRLEIERKREEWRLQHEWKSIDPPPAERVDDCLNRFEIGEVDAWWIMNWWMIIPSDRKELNRYDFEFDLHDLPVWDELDDFQHSRIIDSALTYLQQYSPDTGSCNNVWWQKRGSIFWPIVAGCRAFFLLDKYDRIDTLLENDWRKWAPALTYYVYRSLLRPNEEHKRRQKQTFLQQVRTHAPEELIETLLWIAEKENEGETFFLTSRIETMWDSQLANRFLELIDRGALKPANERQVLQAICQYKFNIVRDILESWLTGSIPKDEKLRGRAILAGRLLLEYAEDAAWRLIWPQIKDNDKFGRELIENISSDHFRFRNDFAGRLTQKLSEQAVADLVVWLFQYFPPESDPKKGRGFTTITTQDNIAALRRALPRNLAERGTKEALQQLQRMQKLLGVDFSYYQSRAVTTYLQSSWHPLIPSQFRELLSRKHMRWIQSGSQLLDVICELLNNLNADLQGKDGGLPAAPYLWDQWPDIESKRRRVLNRPKDENRLSDYVARYLRRELAGRGVLISRENQVRRGSYTDIFIVSKPVFPEGELDQTITVVIEVKGCWHRELKTAMREQLKDRYLVQNGLRHGIYLVGRFMCDAWNDKSDNRLKASPKDDDELMPFLDEQARNLSSEGYDIRAYLLNVKL